MSAVVFALTAAPASAATLRAENVDSCLGDARCQAYGFGHPVPVTVLTAGPGERNLIRFETGDDGSWTIRDRGAALTGHPGCTTLSKAAARCPATEGESGTLPGLRIVLGDGADELFADTKDTWSVVDGGPGADYIDVSASGSGYATIDGGTGADHLSGGPGATLSFATRTRPVMVDLRELRTSDGDYLAPFAVVVGGAGDDMIRGSGHDETFHGGAGNDRLLGSYGDDQLFGGPGADRLFGQADHDLLDGGAGDDRLDGGLHRDRLREPEGGRNLLRGGPGPDTIDGGAGPDTVDAGAGDDAVDVRGGGPDRVDCGPGRDRLQADEDDSRHGC